MKGEKKEAKKRKGERKEERNSHLLIISSVPGLHVRILSPE
jgi:hypothetical protein